MPTLLQGLISHLRYGARMLLKTPAFTAVAILSLALGIGANTAIFSLIDAVLLKLLPVQDPQQLVTFTDNDFGVSIGMSGGVRGLLSNREFEALRDRTQSFTGLFAVQSQMDRRDASIDGQPPEKIRTRLVSGDYFAVLRTRPIAGRMFTSADEHGPGTAPFAVASYSFWQKRFGGSPAIFDKTIRANNAAIHVIGIADPAFRGETVSDVPDMQPQMMPGRMWLADDPEHPFDRAHRPRSAALNNSETLPQPPCGASPLCASSLEAMWLSVVGRLKPGVSIQQAKAKANVVFKQIIAEEFAGLPQAGQKDAGDQTVDPHPAANGLSTLRGDFAEPLFVLIAIVGMVLLIACANVANLLLARAAARQKEIGIRLALGAERARVIRQFPTESVLLSVLGGLAGILFALAGVRLLLRMVQNGPDPISLDVSPDLRVLLFTIGVSILTGVIFGLAPAWRSVRVNVSNTLKEAGPGMTGSGAKIAVSVALLIGAGWFVRTLRNLENVDLGYQHDKLLLLEIDPLSAGYKGSRLANLYRDLHARLQQIPGVHAVAYSQNGLFSGSESGDRLGVEGFKPQKKGDASAQFDEISPNYFSALGIPVLIGREIGPQYNETAPRVCVVNESLAKFFFKGTNPIGKHITHLFPDTYVTMEIVGIVGNVRDHSLRGEIDRRFYLPVYRPMGQEIPPFMNYEIRTLSDPAAVLKSAQDIVRKIDQNIPVNSARSLIELVDRRLTQQKLIAQLSAGFGALALLPASIGHYGVLSILLGLGLVIGVPTTLACARFVQSKLYGLKAADPLTLSVGIGIMIAVAIVSGYLPARRAARVDPLKALRYE